MHTRISVPPIGIMIQWYIYKSYIKKLNYIIIIVCRPILPIRIRTFYFASCTNTNTGIYSTVTYYACTCRWTVRTTHQL